MPVRSDEVETPPLLSAWVRWLIVGAAAAYLAASVYVFWRSAVLQPYADMLAWIARYFEARADGDWAAYLLAPHNLHRIPLTHGLIALDIQVLGGTNWPLILSGAAALVVMAWALAREAALAAPPALKLPAAVLAAAASLMAANVLDASLPITVNYTHAAAFAVLAIMLAERRGQTPLRSRGLAALACAVAAAFGNAAGLAVWPALAYGAIRRGDWRWLAVLSTAGVVFIGLYAGGQAASGGGVISAAARDPAAAALMALNYLTLPWTRVAPNYAWIGGTAFALVAGAAIALRGGPRAPPNAQTACTLILFSLGTAAMAALGRTGLESPLAVPLRYAVFLAPAYAGFMILALPYVERLLRADRGVAEALVIAAVAAMLGQHLAMAPKMIGVADFNRELVADFRAGARTPEMTLFVYPSLLDAEAISARTRAEGLYQGELHLKPRPAAR